MNTNTSTNTADVTVQFDPLRAPGGRVIVDRQTPIQFTAELGKVTFTLDVKTGAPVTLFPSNPIQWVNNSNNLTPINQPRVATVSRSDDGKSTTIMIQALPQPETYSFFIIVQTIEIDTRNVGFGRFFGTDPTIIIMRPNE